MYRGYCRVNGPRARKNRLYSLNRPNVSLSFPFFLSSSLPLSFSLSHLFFPLPFPSIVHLTFLLLRYIERSAVFIDSCTHLEAGQGLSKHSLQSHPLWRTSAAPAPFSMPPSLPFALRPSRGRYATLKVDAALSLPTILAFVVNAFLPSCRPPLVPSTSFSNFVARSLDKWKNRTARA